MAIASISFGGLTLMNFLHEGQKCSGANLKRGMFATKTFFALAEQALVHILNTLPARRVASRETGRGEGRGNEYGFAGRRDDPLVQKMMRVEGRAKLHHDRTSFPATP